MAWTVEDRDLRAVLLSYTDSKGKSRFGSGLRIGGRLVLTSDHCADGPDLQVQWQGGEPLPATLRVRSDDEDVDIAVLEIPQAPELPPIAFARVDRAVAGRIEGCQALGFPGWNVPSGKRRARVQVDGYIPTAEVARLPKPGMGDRAGGLALKVDGPLIWDEYPLDEDGKPIDPWGGMSGAAVIVDGRVIGVVRSHNRAAGVGSLIVVPIDAIEELPPKRRAALWQALGVTGVDALPVLSPVSSWASIASPSLAVPLTAAGKLPTVDKINMYRIGVKDSPYMDGDDPYVPRAAFDAEIDEALAAVMSDTPGRRSVVVVVGPTTVGKSRLLFEAVGRVEPKPAVIVPIVPGAGLLDVIRHPGLRAAAAGRAVVLWLDDFHQYLQPGGLTRAVLAAAEEAGIRLVVAATMTTDRYKALSALEGSEAAPILHQARKVRIDDALDDEERAAAAGLYPDENFDVGVGIAEQLVSAPRLRSQFEDGTEAGKALVRAAVDWRRAGLNRPIPQVTLLEMATRYLTDLEPTKIARPETVTAEIDWACTAIARHISLLREIDLDGDIGFVPNDYLPSFLDGHGRPGGRALTIPDHGWDAVARAATDDEVLGVGFEALLRRHAPSATAAGERAAHSDDPEIASIGRFFRGQVGYELGDYRNARKHYEDFLRGAPDETEMLAPAAKLNLGLVLDALGEPSAAQRLFGEVADSGDADLEARAELNLGKIQMDRGNYAEAAASFSRYRDNSDEYVRATAHGNLAFIAIMRADVNTAEQHLRVIGESTVPAIQAMAGALRGVIAIDDGDFDAAEAEFRQVLKLDVTPPQARAVALANLGEVRFQRGDKGGARELLQAAIDSGLPSGALPAKITMARMLFDTDVERADQLLGEVAASDEVQFALRARVLRLMLRDITTAPLAELEELSRAEVHSIADLAAIALGMALAARDETAAALPHVERAAKSTSRRLRTNALVILGDLTVKTDPQLAADHWRRALRERDGLWSAEAAIRLARRAEGVSAAVELYRMASDLGRGHREIAARAADLCGVRLQEADNLAGAREWYRRAISYEDPQWSSEARLDLALLELAATGLSAAEPLLQEVIDTGPPDYVELAKRALAEALLAAGSAERAAELLTEVLRTATGTVALHVEADLGYALALLGNIEIAERHLMAAISADDATVSPLARVNLGLLWSDTGRSEEAVELWRAVLTSENPNAVALAELNLSAALGARGRLHEAREHLDRAVASGHVDPGVERLRRVQLAAAADDLDEAENLARDSLAMDGIPEPQQHSLLFHLGLILRAQERFDDAVTTFGELLDTPNLTLRAGALDQLGDMQRLRGDVEGARKWYQQAINTGHPIWSAQATIDLADLLIETGQPATGRALLKELLTRDPPSDQAGQARGMLDGEENP